MINITKNTKNTIILPLYELVHDIIQTIIKTDTIIEKDTIINGILSPDYELYFDNNDKKINIKDISLYPERASKFIIIEGETDDIELNEGQGTYTVSSNGYTIKKGIYAITGEASESTFETIKTDKKIYKAHKRRK